MTLIRNIFYNHPVKLLPDDLKEGFDLDAIVTVTVETVGEYGPGTLVAETVYDYLNYQVIKISKRSFTLQ